MASVTFKGVFPILVTPFDDHGNLDLESFDRTVRFMADIGVNGVTIIGVLGESNRMLDVEREQLIKTAVGAAGGRIPVIVGTSYSGTRATLELSQDGRISRRRRCDGHPPARIRAQRRPHLRIFSSRWPKVSPFPSSYRTTPPPPRSTCPSPSFCVSFGKFRSSPASKEEAVPTPPKITALLNGIGDRAVTILTGLGALYGAFDLARGAHGFMTGFAFPEVLLALVRSAENRDFDTVHDIYHRYLPLIVYEQQPGVALRKEIFRLRGLIASSYVRHPGANIDPTTADHLKSLLHKMLPGVDITRPIEV